MVESIEKSANKYLLSKQSEKVTSLALPNERDIHVCKEFTATLDDTEIVFRHKHKEVIYLEDIFVFPDLKDIKCEYDQIGKSISAFELIDANKDS